MYRFLTSDLDIFKSLANQSSVAIRNASLFEEVQQARSHAEKADKAKSAFFASTSHELRTPLNAIINLTSVVRNGMMGAVNERQVELLTLVVQSDQNLLSLINDVLDMSKIESGSLKLYVEPHIDLESVILNACTTAQRLLGDKFVQLTIDLADDLPLMTIDKHRMNQIMLSLLSNACKFTEEGEIRVEAFCYKDEVQVSVSDTGAGIAPEDHNRVFEKFKQTNTGLRQRAEQVWGCPSPGTSLKLYSHYLYQNTKESRRNEHDIKRLSKGVVCRR